MSNYISNFN